MGEKTLSEIRVSALIGGILSLSACYEDPRMTQQVVTFPLADSQTTQELPECRETGDYDCFVSKGRPFVQAESLNPSDILAGVTIAGVVGTLTPCSQDGETSCIASSTYQALDMTKVIPANLRNGVTIAGVTGTYPSASTPLAMSTVLADLPAFIDTRGGSTYEWFQSDGTRLTGAIQADQRLSASIANRTFDSGLYRSITVKGDSNLTPNNIKKGTTILGIEGAYPSQANRLVSADSVTDLPTFTATGSGQTYEWFLSDGTRMTGRIEDDQTLTSGRTDRVLNSGLYRSVTILGDSTLVSSHIRNGVNILGVAGTLASFPACTTDGAFDCTVSASGQFKAANISSVTSWDIRAGKTLAGISGNLLFYRNMVNLDVYNRTSGSGAEAGTDVYDSIDDYNNGDTGNPFIPTTNPWGGVNVPPGPNWSQVSGICDGLGACVVRDGVTGLMWAKDDGVTRAWEAAIAYCENRTYGGYTDWRLPSQKELMQVYINGFYSNQDKLDVFLDDYYWSSSSVSDLTAHAWITDLSKGYVYDYLKTNEYRALCVR